MNDNFENDYKNKIGSVINSDSFPHRFNNQVYQVEYRPEGKTAKVFRVYFSRLDESLAFKFFEPGQHQAREIGIFENYLGNGLADVPKVVHINHDRTLLVLKWIDGFKPCQTYEEIDYMEVALWLKAKHDYSRKLFAKEIVDVNKQIQWMLHAPIELLKHSGVASSHSEIRDLLNISDALGSSYNTIAARGYPMILEHGDLEPQNILKDVGGNYKYIDWAAAFRSFGLSDIGQLKRGLTITGKVTEYSRISDIFMSDYGQDFQKSINTFMCIKELLVLEYCIKNDLNGNSERFLESLKICRSILPEFYLLNKSHA